MVSAANLMMLSGLVLILLLHCTPVHLYPDGAPADSCTNGMFPSGHGVTSQPEHTNEFGIKMSVATYTVGASVTG